MKSMKHQIGHFAVISIALLTTVGVSQVPNDTTPQGGAAGYKSSRNLHGQSATWEIQYKAGSFKLNQGHWLKGAFVQQVVGHRAVQTKPSPADQSQTQPVPLFAISPDQLSAIYFDSKAEKISDLMQRMPRSGCGYAKWRMPKRDSATLWEAFIGWDTPPSRMSRVLEHLVAHYPVQIVWTDSGVRKEVTVTIDNCEYASFLANLRWFAGARWEHVSQQSR